MPEQGEGLRAYIFGSSSLRARPSCARRTGAAVGDGEVRGLVQESLRGGDAGGVPDGEVDAHVHATRPRSGRRGAVEAVGVEERLEPRRYPPSCSGGTAASSHPGHAGSPAGRAAPRPRPSARIRHRAVASGPAGWMVTADVPPSAASARAASMALAGSGPPTSMRSHRPPRERGTASSPRRRRTTSMRRARALDGERVVGEQGRGRVGGGGHVRVAEQHEHGLGRDRDEVHGGGGDHDQRALAAREHPGQVGAVLGEQVSREYPETCRLNRPTACGWWRGSRPPGHPAPGPPRGHGPRGSPGPCRRGCRGRRRCRPSARRRRPVARRRCCRSSRRAWHGSTSRGPGRTGGRAVRRVLDAASPRRARRRRCAHPGRGRGCGSCGAKSSTSRSHGVARHRGARPAGGEGQAVLPATSRQGATSAASPVGDHLGTTRISRGRSVLGTAPSESSTSPRRAARRSGTKQSTSSSRLAVSHPRLRGPASRYPARRGSANGQPAQPSGRRRGAHRCTLRPAAR
jgi:hypothetical protein